MHFSYIITTTITALLFCVSLSHAAPSLNQVTNGNATITQSGGGDTTTITQTTPNATIDWHSFNVVESQAVVFNQPSTQSLAINNILDANPSQILGSITANGRIVLLNPNGFYFGANSSVSAHTFIAAATSNSNATYNSLTNTLSINNNDTITGTITLNGTITTTNKTQLIARNITIAPTSTTTATHLTITAHNDITIHGTLNATNSNTNGNIDLFATNNIIGAGTTTATNNTTITTDYLSLTGTYTSNNALTLTANNILINHQATFLTPSFTLNATNSALISATITANNQYYHANNTLSFIAATIQGTTINIGDFKTPTITIYDTTTISANTTTTNAGTILLQAANQGTYDGTITATSIHGNGGFIELSATHLTLAPTLTVSTTSTYGTNGTILIDPEHIIITDNPTPVYRAIYSIFSGLSSILPVSIPANSYFGRSVALNDTHALIGAYGVPYTTRGNAYLFNLTTNDWTDLATTTGQPITTLALNSDFGFSVALNDTYALIGAPGISSDRGDAYLYKLDGTNSFTANCATTGTFTSPWCRLSASAGQPIIALASNSQFGNSVALNATYALIGANRISSYRGNAYLYKLDGTNSFTANCATTGTFTSPWCRLSASAGQPIIALASNSRFGGSVALNNIYALIGASRVSNRGNAYLYKLDGTNSFTADCTTTGTLTSPWCSLSASTGQPVTTLASVSYFGTSVALNNTYALIGASGVLTTRGNAYLYKLDGTNSFTANCATTGTFTSSWCTLSSSVMQPITALASGNTISTVSYFGRSVALNNTYALIGASGVSSRGNAYLYRLDGTNRFTANCATTGTPTSPWCSLSSSTGQPITALASNSLFGGSVALNNTYALIGAIRVSSNRGNAYLFNLTTNTWKDLATTIPTSTFGTSVALNNTYALIGANGVSSSRGNAYLFNLTTNAWTDLATTTGQPITALASNSFFGISVALNDTYALIGARGVSTVRGDAYLYKLDGTNSFTTTCATTSTLTSPWCTLSSSSMQPITALASQSSFGTSVALNNTYALIGAWGADPSNQGDAYLYKLDGTNSFTTTCATTSTLTSPWCTLSSSSMQPITALAANSNFGISVALNNTYALIGAHRVDGLSSDQGDAYLYKLDGTNSFTANCATTGTLTSPWCTLSSSSMQPITALASNSFFGISVALNDTYALIGANGASDQGDAYLYKLDGTNSFTANCATTGTLTSPWCTLSSSSMQPITALASSSRFGSSVALNNTYALIGAWGVSSQRGDAYLYKLDGTNGFTATCTTTGTLTSPWCTLSSSVGQPITALAGNSNFGVSVALNNTYALIGAWGASSNQGNAYLFNLTTNVWTDLVSTTLALPSNGDFGSAVALNNTYALIGAPGVSSNRGNAYLFNLTTNTWTDLATTTGQPVTALASNNGFGGAVALNDTHALIGARGANNAYLYKLDGTNSFTTSCATTGTLTSPWCTLSSSTDQPITALGSNGGFGTSVALNDTYALIGANRLSVRGNAYLYKLDGTNSFTANCATTGTLTSPWCVLSSSTGQPITALAINSYFGTSVALNDTYALIGASSVSLSRGNAYLYKLDGTNRFTANCATTGTPTSPWCTLSASTGQPITTLASSSRFGTSVALNNTYALIGARGREAILIGSLPLRGNAYLYKLDGTNSFTTTCATTGGSLTSPWCTLSASTGQPITALPSSSSFGYSVALNNTYALIGVSGVASNRGDAYLYTLDGTNSFNANCTTTGTPTSPWCTLSASTGQPITALVADSDFGTSVALNDTYALIGASGVSLDRGEAYLVDLKILLGSTIFTPSQVLTMLQAGHVSLVANKSITVSSAVTYSGSNALTLTSGDGDNILIGASVALPNSSITLNSAGDILLANNATITSSNVGLSASTGSIGTATAPITIARSTGDWTTANTLTLTAGSNIYLSTATAGAHTAIPTSFANTFSLNQTAGDITIEDDIDFSSATIILKASSTTANEGNIGFSDNDITASSLSLTATGDLTGTTDTNDSNTGTLNASTLTLDITGNIGASGAANHITIARSSGSGDWTGGTGGNLSLTTGTTGSIYLATATAGAHTAIPTSFANTFSLNQTAGNIAVASAINRSSATIILNASATSATISISQAITASSASLTASGITATSSGRLNAPTIVLNAGTGNIGTSLNPLAVVAGASDGTFTMFNADGADIYLSRGTAAGDTELMGYITNTSGTHYINGSGNVSITTVALPVVTNDVSSCTTATNGVDTCVFTGSGATAEFTLSRDVITNTTNITITGGTISLTATAGDIGSATNPIIISSTNDSTTGSFTSLTLSATGSIYVTRSDRVLQIFSATTFSVSHGASNRLFLYQTNGAIATQAAYTNTSLNLTVDPTTANAFTLSHALSLQSFTIANSSSITTTAGSITAGTVSLTSAGAIGTSTNPLTIDRSSGTGDWTGGTGGNLSLTTGTTGNIYLSTSTAGAHTAIPTSFANTFSLNQTVGNIAVVSAIDHSSATIIINASAAIANISLSQAITASSISLTATRITATSSGSLNAPTIVLDAGTSNIGFAANPLAVFAGASDGTFTMFRATGAHIYLIRATAAGDTELEGYVVTPIPNPLPTSYITGPGTISITSSAPPVITNDISSCTAAANNIGTCMNTGTGATATFSLSRTAITNTTDITITAGTITLTATAGDIGSATNPIIISSVNDSTTGTFTSLTLSATGSIYVRRSDRVLQILATNTFSVSHGTSGSLYLYQTNGAIATHADYASTSIALNVTTTTQAFSVAHNLAFASITIRATSIESPAGSLSAPRISLNATAGSIGIVATPLKLSSSTSYTGSQGAFATLSLASNNNAFYLERHTNAAALYGGIPSTTKEIVALTQTTGNIILTAMRAESEIAIRAVAGSILGAGPLQGFTTLQASTIRLFAEQGSIGAMINPVIVRGDSTNTPLFSTFIASACNASCTNTGDIFLAHANSTGVTELTGYVIPAANTPPASSSFIRGVAGGTISIILESDINAGVTPIVVEATSAAVDTSDAVVSVFESLVLPFLEAFGETCEDPDAPLTRIFVFVCG